MNESRVYFVLRADGLVKIGVTRNLPRRLHALRLHHGEVHLLADQPGTRVDEARLHQIFGGLRVYGEWFRLGDDLLTYIALLRQSEPLSDAPLHVYALACREVAA